MNASNAPSPSARAAVGSFQAPAAICADSALPAPVPRPRNFDPALFAELKAAWKAAAKAKSIGPGSIAAWALIRGADPRRGFTAVSNPTKLANGAQPWAARDGALSSCSALSTSALSPWEHLLSKAGCSSNGWRWSGSHPLLALLARSKP